MSTPPTFAERQLANMFLQRADLEPPNATVRSVFADPHTLEQATLSLVDQLREGRRFIVCRDVGEANAVRRIFPRAPVILKPGAAMETPRLAPLERAASLMPAPCLRCHAEAAGQVDPDDMGGPMHLLGGDCTARWGCDAPGCPGVYTQAEIDASRARCSMPGCGSNNFVAIRIPPLM